MGRPLMITTATAAVAMTTPPAQARRRSAKPTGKQLRWCVSGQNALQSGHPGEPANNSPIPSP